MAPARTCELSVNAQEVNCVVVAMDHGFAASRLAVLDRHLERVCREGGGRVQLIDQPTTRRLNASSTTAQSTLPSRVGWSVMRRFTPEASRRRG